MRIQRSLVLLFLSLSFVAFGAFGVSASVDGPCTASITLPNGTTPTARPEKISLDREEISKPFTYTGSHTTATEGVARSYDGGAIWLKLPIGRVVLSSWEPEESTTAISNTGEHRINARLLPPINVVLAGRHVDSAGDCSGEIVVALEGEGSLDIVYKVAALALVLFFAVLTFMSGRQKPGHRRGRWLLGIISGILLGATGAALLLIFRLLELDSFVVFLLPLLGLILGLILVVSGPFARAGQP